jgi:hypothetical protein
VNKEIEPSLDVDLSEAVTVIRTIPRFDKWKLRQHDLHVDYQVWWDAVIKPCAYFNAISYTASFTHLEKCQKLVCSRPPNGVDNGRTEVRLAANVHTKLYLIYARETSTYPDIWVGSGNVVSSNGWLNIMMQANYPNTRTLMLYFDRVWEILE